MAGTIILGVILLLVLYTVYYARKTGVQTQASFPAARCKMLEVLAEDMARRTEVRPYNIIDMGSGCGQLCRKIARNLPEAQVIGVELSPLPWLQSVVTRALLGPRNLRFVRRDFWKYDISHADAVIMLLEHSLAERLGQKLHAELRPGSLIASNEEPLGDGWVPVETRPYKLLGMFTTTLYIYRQA